MSTEQQLADELTRRADRLDSDGPTLHGVLDRAHRIRRRRRVAIGVVVAAMVGTLAPSALWVSGALQGGDPQQPPVATQAPRPTPAPTPTTPSDGPLDPSSLPRGEAPSIPYLEGRTLHLPDGSTREVAESRDFLVMRDGALVTWNDRTVTIERSGSSEQYDLTAAPTANADRDILVWATPEGLTTWTAEEGARPLTDRIPGIVDVVELTGDGSCHTGGRCVVHYEGPDGPAWVDNAGNREDEPLFEKVVDVAGGLVAGVTETSDDGSCSRIVREGHVETCDYSLLGFSGEPGVLAASDPYLSGHGLTSLTFLDLELEPIRHWEVRSVTDYRWEDEENLLTAVYDEGDRAWYLVRFSTDGDAELAADPVPGGDMLYPWSFEGQPAY